MMSSITEERTATYLETLLPPRSSILQRLEVEGRLEGIPNIAPAGAAVLRMLCSLHKPKRILEIGTAIGYSAIHMAEAAQAARLVTIELDEQRAARAVENFREADVADRVELLVGDALDHLPELDETFDMIFIDAAKGKYPQFLQEAIRLCRTDGIIVSDNVLFRGLTAVSPDEIDRRHRGLVQKIRDYNELLRTHPGLQTTFLAVGDGMAVSIKVRAKEV